MRRERVFMNFKKLLSKIILSTTLALGTFASVGVVETQTPVVETHAKTDYATVKSNGKVYKNLGKAKFNSKELAKAKKSYEKYSNLDRYGRAGVAMASISRGTMPKKNEKRGSISTVKPSGWSNAKYNNVPGKYLYNRSHLIGWQLSAENANKKNLITGTRQMNVNGMLPFEDKVANYCKKTGKHVLYRVTPYYKGKEKVARTVRIEAKSVEDNGKGINFDVLMFNEQKGIIINYATGSSKQNGKSTTQVKKVTKVSFGSIQIPDNTKVYTTSTGKCFHKIPKCGNTKTSGQTTAKVAKSRHLTPCKKCYGK